MNHFLKNFIEEIKNNKKLKNEFIKCESLKESYDKFMKGKCSYEEYEKFFKDLIKSAALLSDEDLEQVSGGGFLTKILAPITIMTTLIGSGAIPAYAAGPNGSSANTATTNASSNVDSGEKQESSKAESTKYEIDGFLCEVSEDKKTVLISNKDDKALFTNLNMSNIHNDIRDKIKCEPEYYIISDKLNKDHSTLYINKDFNANLSFESVNLKLKIKVDPENQKYFADEVALWEKNDKGEPEKLIKIFNNGNSRLRGGDYTIPMQRIRKENKEGRRHPRQGYQQAE